MLIIEKWILLSTKICLFVLFNLFLGLNNLTYAMLDTYNISDELVYDFNNAMANKDMSIALESLARLQLLIYADQRYFAAELKPWEKLSEEYSRRIEQEGNIANVKECLLVQKSQEIQWLIQRIKQDTCDVSWYNLWSAPLHDQLKKHRIDTLQSFQEFNARQIEMYRVWGKNV